MRALYTADLHLEDPEDAEYRWHFLEEWLPQQIENRRVQVLFILGDLTHRKDQHSALLVNRLCRALRTLTEQCPVHVLKGNHDFIDPANPFFSFLSGTPGIHFYSIPVSKVVRGVKIRFIPYQHAGWWDHPKNRKDVPWADRILFHQPLRGAVGSNGYGVGGGSLRPFRLMQPWAFAVGGDVHVPQTLEVRGKPVVHYCGSPYPIHFGDDYPGRVLFEEEGALKSVPYPSIRKTVLTLRSVEELKKSGLHEGDRAKVVVQLPRADFIRWPRLRTRLRRLAEARGIRLHSVKLKELPGRVRLREEGTEEPTLTSGSPLRVFDRYCELRGTDNRLAGVGRSLLKGAADVKCGPT